VFQSLFSWITLCKAVRRPRRSALRVVSILVFLDHSLRLDGYPYCSPDARFVSILVFLDHSLQHLWVRALCVCEWVSILVFLDHSLQVSWLDPDEVTVQFQSLFSWFTLCKTTIRLARPSLCLSFNPCFPGSLFAREEPPLL